ncbi:MAG: hypothetical protein PHD58_05700 [Anaerolineales bacterium]|nr:hypothetical protein [Anaerolineales bacterium]
MAYTLILHIPNSEPIMGESEKLPSSNDTLLIISNPRSRSGKDLPYIDSNTITVLWPVSQVNFIEVITSSEEEIIGFVRE